MYPFLGGENVQINSLAENSVLFRPITLKLREVLPAVMMLFTSANIIEQMVHEVKVSTHTLSDRV